MVTTTSGRPLRLAQVRHQLERWRRTRPHRRAPIPESLWAAAVALVPQRGLYGTARGLRLDYGNLKRHVEAADRAGVPAGFVELPSAAPVRDACVLALEGPRATVRLRLTGVAIAEIAHLARMMAGADA